MASSADRLSALDDLVAQRFEYLVRRGVRFHTGFYTSMIAAAQLLLLRVVLGDLGERAESWRDRTARRSKRAIQAATLSSVHI